MAASRNSFYIDSSNLTNFKAWAMFVSNAMAAGGWTKTLDSGQVDWSTIAAGPPLSNWTVYEIWQAGDNGSRALPLFVKIAYGSHTTGTGVGLQLSMGTGSNLAGTLINVTSLYTWTVASAGVLIAYECMVSTDVNRLQLFMFRTGTTAQRMCYSVERSVDDNGNATDEFTMIVGVCTSGGYGLQMQYITKFLYVATAWTVGLPMHNNNDTAGSYQNCAPLFGVRVVLGYEHPPCMGLLRGCINDWTDGDIVQFTFYGATHTYVVSRVMGYFGYAVTQYANNATLIRFE